MDYLIGGFHWLTIAYNYLYPLLFKNRVFDIIYILVIAFIILGWILLKGECAMSLFFKQQQNPNYKMGDNVFDLSDMQKVLPIGEKLLINIIAVMTFVHIYLIYIVNTRSNILDTRLIYVLFFMYIYTILDLRKFYNPRFYHQYNISNYSWYLNKLFILLLFAVFVLLFRQLIR